MINGREGTCRRRGRCCIEAGRFLYTMAGEEIRLKELRPLDPEASICPALLFEIPSRRAACILHEDGKPEVCRLFPISPAEILEDCGFSFPAKEGSG